MHSVLKINYGLYTHTNYRAFYTSCVRMGSRQIGNAMKKVLGGTRKKKVFFNDTLQMPSPNVFSQGTFEGKRSGNSRRATVLNKLFMRHITDQMSNGKCSSEILGHGIEINRVQVTPNYQILKVYWIAKGTEHDEVIDKILEKNAGLLRHELSQLRVMGVVPTIQFVRDKHYANIVELDSKLAIADFGEDHVALDPTLKLRTELEIFGPLEDHVKERLKELDSKHFEEYEELPVPLPPMPQNVLGLNHADILDRLKKSIKRSEARHRDTNAQSGEDSWVTFKITQPINEDPVLLSAGKSQREAFKEFLHKRQLLRLKAKGGEKNFIPDLEIIREELRERHLNSLRNFDIVEDIEEDFIIEDLDEETK